MGDGSSLMTKITLLLLIFSAVLVLCFGDLTIRETIVINLSDRRCQKKAQFGMIWLKLPEIL